MTLLNDRKSTRILRASVKDNSEGTGERGLEVRQSVGLEVSPEQLNQIGGGCFPTETSDGAPFPRNYPYSSSCFTDVRPAWVKLCQGVN